MDLDVLLKQVFKDDGATVNFGPEDVVQGGSEDGSSIIGKH